jgi:hypothetical protein
VIKGFGNEGKGIVAYGYCFIMAFQQNLFAGWHFDEIDF